MVLLVEIKKQGLFPLIGVQNSQISYKYKGPCCNPEPNIQEYIIDIQNYIRNLLETVLTSDFITTYNLAITDKTSILDNIELCWVGEPEHFYSDVSNLDIQNNGAKIFSHFTETIRSHSIRLQTNDSSFVTIPFTLRSDIFSKIQYVNSKVPDNLKDTEQGYHTLGLINNTISFPYKDPSTNVISNESVKYILKKEKFGLFQYNNLYSYNITYQYVTVTNGTYKATYNFSNPDYCNATFCFKQTQSNWNFYDNNNIIGNDSSNILQVLVKLRDNSGFFVKTIYSDANGKSLP